jgi:hypothetical protein
MVNFRVFQGELTLAEGLLNMKMGQGLTLDIDTSGRKRKSSKENTLEMSKVKP